MNNWLDKYENGGSFLGTTNVGRDYSPAWGGQFQDGGKKYLLNPTAPTVINAERLKEKKKVPYEPTSAVKNTKAALAVGSLAPNPLLAFGSALAGSVYDFGTATKYYLDDQKEKANEDFVQGVLGLLPIRFLKRYGMKNEPIYKNLKGVKAMKVASDAKTVTEGEYESIPPLSFAMGGSIPGSVGFTYARTGDIPDNGKYAKKTLASAQNGKEMQFYQQGLDFQPKTISQDGTRVAPRPRPLTETEWQENKRISEAQKIATEKHNKQILEERQKARNTKGTFKEKNFNIGEKFRMFPGSVGGAGELFDDYINPLKFVGDMASNLGNSRTPQEAALNVAMTAGLGAIGFDPLGSALKSPALKNPSKFLERQNIYKYLPENADVNVAGVSGKNPYLHNKKQILLSDFESDINKYLSEGLGIKKLPNNLKVKVQQGNQYFDEVLGSEPKFTIDLYNEGRPSGYVGLDKLNSAEYNIPNQKGTIYTKVSDFPYAFKDEDILKGSGISGEINKAITNALQKNDLGHLFSSTEHTAEGLARWKNLVEKNKAVEVAPNRFKLLKEGGVIKDDRGQWAHPGEITQIDSNDITMQGVPYPVLGIGADGEQMMMQPGEDYKFNKGPVTEFPMAQNGTRQPIYVDNPNDSRLKAYNDSLNLHKAYEFQKQNYKPGYEAWLKDVAKDYPGGVEALRKEREKNLGKPLSKQFFSKDYKKSKFKSNVPDSHYDPLYPQEKPIINYYKSLIKNDKDYRIGMHSSPDLWHKNINPIGSYYDGASSPIYKKPEQPIEYRKSQPKKEPVKKPETIVEKPVEKVVEKPAPSIVPSTAPLKPMNRYEGRPVYSPGAGLGVPSALVGFENKGDTTYIQPEDYERFAVPGYGKRYIESKKKLKSGGNINNLDAQPIEKLDQLTNFTNYNKPTKGGWLDKYE